MNSAGFGRQMAEARNALGMTQPELSARLGKGGSVSAIQKWERGDGLPKPQMMARIRAELGMEGDEEETRSQWPARVQHVTATLGDVLSELPSTELRKFRHDFIRRFMQFPDGQPQRRPWPNDVDVIVDMIGAWLVNSDYAENDRSDMTD